MHTDPTSTPSAASHCADASDGLTSGSDEAVCVTPKRRFPWWLVGIVGLTAAGAAALVLTVRPDLWLVERVVIEGADRAGVAGLRHLADIPNGTTAWGVDPEAAARGVQQHPWVRSATGEFEWPSTVRLVVQEHQPAALLAGSSMQYLSSEGVVIGPASTDDLDYPVITGVDPELGLRHPELPTRVAKDALVLLEHIDHSGVLPRERVGEIHFSETRGFTVHVQEGPQIVFDLESFERQAQRLVQLVDQGVDLRSQLHIDLAPSTVAIVKPLPLAPPALPVPAVGPVAPGALGIGAAEVSGGEG
ncbi:MAG: cell division protein FtsQ/DivIB [Myxococcota bacterium]